MSQHQPSPGLLPVSASCAPSALVSLVAAYPKQQIEGTVAPSLPVLQYLRKGK